MGRSRRKPFREDMLVLSISVLMVFFLYASIDYPIAMETIANNPGSNSGGGTQPQGGGTVLTEEDLAKDTGRTNEGQTTEIAVELPWSGVKWVNVTLSWSDDIGSNDEFELKVLLDNEKIDSISGTSGELMLNIEDLPSGNYTFAITCVNAPGLLGPLPVDRDSGNDWSLSATVVREVEP